MILPPRPFLPILENEALPGSHEQAGWFTKHQYDHSELITLGDITEQQTTGIGHFFRCTVTGAIRRYGFDSPYVHGERDEERGS